jgi:hypothetical protein
VARVEEYLEGYRKAEERQGATSTLQIPFTLFEDGTKLEKHLSAQRRYLRDTYESVRGITAKRGFTDSLATTAAFIGFSLPTFFTGLLFILFFSIYLDWLPFIYRADIDATGLTRLWTTTVRD